MDMCVKLLAEKSVLVNFDILVNIEQADTLKAQREMYQALKARKEALEEALRKKTEDLKNLCFQEGELTGELPADTPLEPGEKAPAFRRRVGTSFSLTKNLQQESGNEREDIIAKLELEYELQSKITAAAFKLSQDKAVGKSVRKQRRQAYTRALNKLKDMEKKLSDMRRNLGLSTRVIQPTSGYNGMYNSNLYRPRSEESLFVTSDTGSVAVRRDRRRRLTAQSFREPGTSHIRPRLAHSVYDWSIRDSVLEEDLQMSRASWHPSAFNTVCAFDPTKESRV